jgi:hypothetical protein
MSCCLLILTPTREASRQVQLASVLGKHSCQLTNPVIAAEAGEEGVSLVVGCGRAKYASPTAVMPVPTIWPW